MLQQFYKFKHYIIVFALAIVGHVLGFGREIAAAYLFGASSITDGIIVGLIPVTLYISIFGTAYANAVIVEIKNVNNVEDVTNSFLPLLIIGVISGAIFLLLADPMVSMLAPGLKNEGRDVAVAFIQLSSLGALFASIAFWGRGLLHLQEKFTKASIADAVPNIGAILGIIVFYPLMGIYGLAIGGVLGQFLQMIIVTNWHLIKFKKTQWLALFSTKQKAIYKNALLAGISHSTLFVVLIVDRYFASQLEEGSVAILNYGQKLMVLPLYTVMYAITTVAFPKLIKLINDTDKFKSFQNKLLIFVGIAAIIISGISILLSEFIVDITFGYGAFSEQNVIDTANIFIVYMFAFIFHSLAMILVKIRYAEGLFKIPLIAGAIAAIVNVILDYYLVVDYQTYGLAFATGVSALVNVLFLFKYSKQKL